MAEKVIYIVLILFLSKISEATKVRQKYFHKLSENELYDNNLLETGQFAASTAICEMMCVMCNACSSFLYHNDQKFCQMYNSTTPGTTGSTNYIGAVLYAATEPHSSAVGKQLICLLLLQLVSANRISLCRCSKFGCSNSKVLKFTTSSVNVSLSTNRVHVSLIVLLSTSRAHVSLNVSLSTRRAHVSLIVSLSTSIAHVGLIVNK